MDIFIGFRLEGWRSLTITEQVTSVFPMIGQAAYPFQRISPKLKNAKAGPK